LSALTHRSQHWHIIISIDTLSTLSASTCRQRRHGLDAISIDLVSVDVVMARVIDFDINNAMLTSIRWHVDIGGPYQCWRRHIVIDANDAMMMSSTSMTPWWRYRHHVDVKAMWTLRQTESRHW
jgi:hypothetical protein